MTSVASAGAQVTLPCFFPGRSAAISLDSHDRCGAQLVMSDLDVEALYNCLSPGDGKLLAKRFPTPSELFAASFQDFVRLGLSDEIAVRLAACCEILRRSRNGPPVERITCPDDAAPYFFELLSDCPQERVALLALDSSHHPLAVEEVSLGGLSKAIVDPRVVFRKLLRTGAARFLMAHNHPSGDLDPSREDIAVTDRLSQAGELLEIPLLDHLIVAGERWISLRDSGHASFADSDRPMSGSYCRSR